MRINNVSRNAGLVSALALLGMTFSAASYGQENLPPVQQDGFVEQLGEKVDRGIERLTNEAQEGWEALQRSVDRFGVQARVYSRLRWDKAIAPADIKVDVEGAGVVVLRGQVRDVQAKRKAVQLAQDTLDVQKVVDRLSVRATVDR